MAAGSNLGAFNTFFSAGISDASGIATTVTTAGTPLPLLGAAFAQVINNSGGALVWNAAAGTLTVALEQGAGTYEIEFAPGNTIGPNTGVKIFAIAVDGVKVGSSVRAVEPATAVQSGMASAKATVALALGDVVTVIVDVGTNGHAVTTRQATLTAKKVA
jgi:hypothetical protein